MTKVKCIGFPRANVMALIHPRNGDKFTATFKHSATERKQSTRKFKGQKCIFMTGNPLKLRWL